MDWNLVISRNRALLLRIVAELFAMLPDTGAAEPGAAFTLPRQLYNAIMLILRPCESAIRRLIIIAARGLVMKPRGARPVPAGLASFAAVSLSRVPPFQLIDPLKDFGLDAFNNNPDPALMFRFAEAFDPALACHQAHLAGQPVNAVWLFSRLRAMRIALNDLPRQARRLARWQARVNAALAAKRPFKPSRLSPFRPGPPPGYRRKDIHQVDAVLKDVHYFAQEAFAKADTS